MTLGRFWVYKLCIQHNLGVSVCYVRMIIVVYALSQTVYSKIMLTLKNFVLKQ